MFPNFLRPATRSGATTTLFSLVFLCLASRAHAQSAVSVYGIIDAGILYQSANGGPGKTGKTPNSSVMFNGPGGDSANYLGFQGTEDLGGGLRAGFQLQGSFDDGTGQMVSSGVPFNQRADVYLENSYGRVTIGRQIDPAYLAMAKVDPRNFSQFFSSATWWYFLDGKTAAPARIVWEQNAVSYSYRTPEMLAGVLYRVGEGADNNAENRAISSGITYDTGKWIGSAAYLVQNDATGMRDLRIWGLGAGYRLGALTLRGTYTDYRLPEGNASAVIGATPTSHVVVAGTGINWQFSPVQMLTAAYYFSEDKLNPTNATSAYVLSDDYWLSKRTKLYAYFGLMHAKPGANGLTNIATAALTSGYPGKDTKAIALGIMHKF